MKKTTLTACLKGGLLIFGFLSFFSQSLEAQRPSATSIINETPPENKVITDIDVTSYQLQLVSAPREFTESATTSKLILELPWYNGSTRTFEVVESSIMNAEFEKNYPDFKTYAVRAIEGEPTSGRIFVSRFGMYATMLTPENMVGIRPQDLNNPIAHEVYLGRHEDDYNLENFECSFDEDIVPFLEKDDDNNSNMAESSLSNGATLKTYNLAIVTTGEFHDGNGGTVAAATAVVTSSVNGIQAMFDKDIAVRFSLLTPMIYTDPNTDPFDPAGAGRTVQAAEAVNTNFAQATYDIGHCFHDSNEPPGGFSGGGVAGLGVVCNDNQSGISGSGYNKAAGWSGSGNNTTNGWHQLAAHEFGHMFDATHTWNGSGGSCSNCNGGNQSSNTAYEIGSGTTIMSYQGICAANQNIPASGVLDNYFHANSLERMVNYINDTNNNQGGSCPTTSATGNTPPVTNANPCSAMLTIPISTPFSIDGTATDADGDNMTICWEQYDEDGAGVCPTHGFIGATAGSSAIAPLFRSYPPTSSTERIFPKMDDIVNGTSSDFEVLPTVGRTMNFRMTTRDNNASGGGMSCDAVSITVDGSAGPFLVTAPNGGETLSASGSITVTWDQANTSSFCSDVNILLSVDGGYNYPYVLATAITNTTQTWTGTLPAGVPNVTNARVKVECADYSCMTFFDISDNDFTITSSCLTESNYICPAASCSLPVGDSGLNLSLNNFFGNGLTSQVFDIESTDPNMDVVTNDVGGTGCFNWGFTSDFEHVVFTVDATGDYTFSHNAGAVFTINSVFTEATFDPADPCPSFLGSNATNLNGSSATSSSSFTVTLTECTEYRLCAYNFGSAQNYTVTMAGAGSLNTSTAGPGGNYSYTFVAVNTSNDIIDEEDSGSDFTSLAAGSYEIYGATYKSGGPTPPNNVTPSTWIGQTISAVLSSGDCALFSTNFKQLTITGGACMLNSSGLANVACNNNGTDCDATDDYITFDLNPMGTSLGATYNVTVSAGSVTPTSGTYGSATTFQLQGGSAGGGNVTVTITDAGDSNCTIMDTVTDPGTCSSACGIPAIANSCATPLITFSGFAGDGFTTNPGAGELCSNNWLPSGFSDNNYVPCGNNTSGDYARGATAGGVGTGGIYAYDDGAGNQALWIQPTGGDFTPGDITLQLQNTTGSTLTDIDLSYDILFLNDQNRANSLNFSYSTDGTNFTSVPALDFVTPDTQDPTPMVQIDPKSTTLSGLNIANNAFFWMRWEGADASGSGARDEYGFDNVAVCPAACNLVSAGLANVQCNNNGTPSDVSDDYITFELNPTGTNLGTSYTVSGATLTPSTANYGGVVSFQTDPGTAGAGDLNLTITDDSDSNCTLSFTVTDPGTCSPDCEITGAGITNVVCNDNGTPSDDTDDYITFDLNPTGNNLGTSYTVSGTNLTPSTGNYGSATSFQTDPGTAGAGNINLTITDDNDGNCTWTFTLTDPGSCSTDCEITASGLANVTCNDNGTTNDPSDDYITFELNPTGFNLGTSYTVSGATLTPSNANYGSATTFQTNPGTAGAGDLNITITDDTDGGCTFMETVTAPGTCSPDCVILTTGLSNVQCNNNGTPSDDSDDYITFDLNPTGNNLGTTYTVLGATLTPTGGNFGQTTSFQTDPGTAGAGDLNLTIRDDNDHGCTLPFTVTDPGSCSTDCELLTSGLSNILCNDNGTPSDVSDDYITFELNPTGNNLGTSYTVSGATLTPSNANYGSATTFQTAPGTAGAGDLNLTITDDNDGNCTLSVTVTDPGNCSPNCEITASGLANIQCNNNGTPTDDTDDYFTFDLDPTGFNLGTSYTVSGATLTPSNANYGSATTFQTDPGTAGAGDLNLTITDDSNGGCTLSVTVTDPGSCSNVCNLSSTGFSNLLCNNNGTPYDPSDDFFTFDLNPIGVNLSTNGYNVTSSVTITPSSANYGSATSFSTPAGSAGNGDLTITMTDMDDGACSLSSTLVDPTPNPNVAASSDPTTCGGSDGSITLGGLMSGSDYNVIYDLGASTDIFAGPFTANVSGEITMNNLSEGTYNNIRVQDDAAGCIGGSLSVTLSDPMTPTYTVSGTDPTTCSGTDGSFTISGLTANTSYDVTYGDDGTGIGPLNLTSDGAGEITISNLNAGSYTNIIVTFASNCSGAAASVNLTDPTTPNPNIAASTDPTSCGGSDGTITIGGLTSGETYTTNYDFNGSGSSQTGLTANGSGEITLSGLSAGSYTNISVTNESSLCSGGSLSQTLSDPSAPTPAVGTLTDPSACGASDGSIQLTGLTANTSYDVTYDQDGNPVGPISLMTNASGELTISSLPAGNYTNIIVALAGCSSSPLSATLSDPNSPTLSETHVDVTCPGGADGSIDLTVMGGTPNYTYDWDNDGTGDNNDLEDLSGLSAGTYSVIVTDAIGCTATLSVTIADGMDNTPPTAVCQDANVSLDATGNATITTADIDNGSSDNCGTTNLSLDNTAFDCSDIGGNTVTLTVDDGNGNSAMCTATVTVEDNTDPMAACQDATVSLDATGNATITTADIDNGSSDNCGTTNLSLDNTAFDCSNIGGSTVTLTVDDGNGNSATCTATVTVEDNTNPTANCQDETVSLDASGNATITTADIDNGSSDNCGTANLSLDNTTFDCSNVGANTVTLTVDDGNGNSATCTATVTVEDNETPVAVCKNITVQLDGSGNASIAAADIDGGSSDNCATNFSANPTAFDCTNLGANTVTLTVDDGNGNSATCTGTVTIEDTVPPVLVCQNISVSLDASGNASITPTDVAPNNGDNCGTANLSLDINAFDCSNVGGNPVTVTADDGNGNTSTCSATVTIVDDTNPMAACQDVTVQLDANGDASITAADIDNGSSDNCGVASTSVSPTAFTCAELGANTVTLTVTDVNGNIGTCTATVTVADDNNPCCDAPMAICQNISVDLDVLGLATIIANDIDGGSLADCGLQSLTASPTTFDCSNTGANTVTLTITDVNGNVDDCTATVNISDVIPPTAVCQDITVTLNLGTAVITPAQIDNGSNDECGVASLALDNQSFTCANVGYNQVTLTVTDNSGNTSTCTANVGVIASADCTPPDILNEDGPTIADPCTCRGNGEFDEEVVIMSGSNQAWEIVTTTLLDPNTLTPFAAGTLFNEIAQGGGQSEYVLNGVHLDGIGYSLEASSPFWPNQTLSISNTCHYPDPVIENLDNVICIGTAPFILQGSGGAGVSGNGSFTINGVAGDVFDAAALGVGVHLISFTFDAGNPANLLPPSDVGCSEAIFMNVNVVETPSNIACNNLEHVSLDPNCQALITPDIILEGTYFCDDDYEIVIADHQGDPVSNPVSGSYIGEDLTVTVTHTPTGNSCWGTIIVEDKSPPTVTCQDRTISCTSSINSVPKALGNDNCDNNPSVNLLDEVINTDNECSDPTPNDGIAGYVTIERTYIAVDDYGNESAPCTQIITVTRPEPGLVDFPDDVTRQCTNPNTNPSSTGRPTGVTGQYCLYEMSHSDVIIPGCGNTFKVVRTWTVLDWCTGEIITQNNAGEDNQQLIDIIDNTPPSITMDDYSVNANNAGAHPQPCFSTELLNPANVSDNCSDFTVKIFTPIGEAIYVNGTDGADGGYIPNPGLPQGDHIIIYQATDECGNSINKEVTVTVADLIAPVAICDEITDVNLSSSGTAEVFAETFDDGSSDQCCLDKFEVARMEDGCGLGTDFGPTVTFCCEDGWNSPVTVVFRAYDCDGNYNDCMVQVNVSDKKEPTLVSCPSPHTINCDFYIDNLEAGLGLGDYSVLDQFGAPEYIDNCDLEITPTVNVNVDECGNGTITRNWSATDPSGNNAPNCTQLIFVNHVSDWGVEFPADETVTCGDEVPEFEEPKIFNESCELVAVSYEDVVFNVVPDACYKIARQWTIINWCVVGDQVDEEVVEIPESQLGLPFPQCDLDGDGDCDDRTFRDSWDGNSFPTAVDAGSNGAPDTDIDLDPWDGYITYEQVIKISDDVAPVFADGCEVPDVCIEDNTCGATVEFPTPTIQDCSPDVQISVDSDLGSGYGPFTDVAPGTYTVTYSAMDQCGNSNACQTTFTVEDCKKPTPYCKNGLIIELMDVDPAMVEIWASDLDAGSFDNCPGDVQVSFSSDVNDQSVTFNCDHVGQQFVELWVTDASGNQDYCSTFVFIQANQGQCPVVDDPLLAGVIETEDGSLVKDVEVNLNTNVGINDMMKTDETGEFHFNVPSGTDLTLTPVKDINPLNGVTTFDLVLISKHILNVDPLDSPYKIIAADANKSNTVTTFDLVVLRKLILFIDTELANNTSWRFVPTDYDFIDPLNPLNEAFPEVININNFIGENNADFVGIKIGDVNGNVDPLELTQVDDRTFIDQLNFQTDDQSLKAGETYTVDFKSNNFNAIGYQFTMNFDQSALEFIEVENGLAKAENFGLALLNDGAITSSWNSDAVKSMNESETIFSLTFKAKMDARLSQVLDLNSRYTTAEAYNENGDLLDINLEFIDNTASVFELYQNRPNPFNEATVIGFQLPQATTATLTITDVSGRTLKVVKGDFEKGYNEITIEQKELNGAGVRYYQLDTPNNTASKKMILLGTK